jgi:hypothetical protein
MITVLNWSLNHWYVFFWLSVLGVFEGVRDFLFGIFEAIAGIGERRHQRRIEEIRAAAPVVTIPARIEGKKPGHCVHRHVTAIVAADDTLVGWLCKSCDQQLEPDWAVREEDL